jgi:uncharacterized membrane protein YkoI
MCMMRSRRRGETRTESMMFKLSTCFLLALAGELSLTEAMAADPSPADLQAEAKITQEQATRMALACVAHSKVKSAELEREHGKLVWSFGVAQKGGAASPKFRWMPSPARSSR